MWQRIGSAFDEAFARLAAVLAADLPGILAMALVVLAATVVAFFVRAVLRFALGRVGFDRRARARGARGVGDEPPGPVAARHPAAAVGGRDRAPRRDRGGPLPRAGGAH